MRNPFTNGKIVAANVNADDYIRPNAERGNPERVMTRSDLMSFASCPSRWLAGYESSGSKSTEWGTLIDCLLLTPDKFKDRYVMQPREYPASKGHKAGEGTMIPWSNNATYCKEWKDAQGGKEILSESDFESAETAILRLKQNPDVKMIVEDSEKQVLAMADYQDRATGITITVKTLMDMVPKCRQYSRAIIDLKTGRDASPAKWPRHVFDYGYHEQGAIQLDVFNAIPNQERIEFRHIVQENVKPYEVALHLLSEEFLNIGRNHYRAALALYCRCLTENHWPTFHEMARGFDGWALIEPAPWMAMQSLEAAISCQPQEAPSEREEDCDVVP